MLRNYFFVLRFGAVNYMRYGEDTRRPLSPVEVRLPALSHNHSWPGPRALRTHVCSAQCACIGHWLMFVSRPEVMNIEMSFPEAFEVNTRHLPEF